MIEPEARSRSSSWHRLERSNWCAHGLALADLLAVLVVALGRKADCCGRPPVL